MLDRTIADPDGIEDEAGETEGLNLLDLETRLLEGKQLRRVTGVFAQSGAPMGGCEIHQGMTTKSALERLLVSTDGAEAIARCYIRGVFDDANASTELLVWAGLKDEQVASDYQIH